MKEKELPLQRIGLNFFESRSETDFTRVYYRMKPGISMYLREMLPSMDDREEVIATTFAKVWGKIHQYDPYWNFSTWVYRIARNEALLFFRGKKRTYSYDAMKEMGINVDLRAGVETPEYAEDEYVGTTERLHSIVLEEIENLPTIYRDVLTLREVEKMKYEDIAQQLDWKVNTVRTRIHKARRLIRSGVTKRDPQLLKQYQDTL